MKLPITDKFLLDLYKLIVEPLDDAFFSFPKTMKEAANPELAAMRRNFRREKGKRDFRQMVYYLKKRGCIKTSRQGAILITPKGVEKILKIKLRQKTKIKRRDGKWIMVIFDIPEKQRRKRDLLRDFLVFMGYQKFQESVWICPYEVFHETETIVKEYNLERYVKLFLVDETIL